MKLKSIIWLAFVFCQAGWADDGTREPEDPRPHASQLESKDEEARASVETSGSSTGTGEPLELNRFAVTGSRIKRADIEGALPVTVIDREAIELSGETSMGDLIRNLPFNSFGSYRSQFSGDSGTAQVDLRGLGAQRSMILIDGKRLSKSPSSTAYQNLNSIPLGSVERIEILSDGASAVYGSDAIGGVINIITREDYTGWEFTYGTARPEWGEGQRENGTAMFSNSSEDNRWLVNYSWNKKDISFARDFPEFTPGDSPFANNFDITDPETGNPLFVWTAIPGGCDISDAYYIISNEQSLTGEGCVYDFARVFAAETSEDTEGLLVKFSHDISNEWSTSIALNGSKTEAWGRFAPEASTSLWWGVPIPVDSPNNPTNPASSLYSPEFGPNVPVNWAHRFETLGFRDKNTDTSLIDADWSFNGAVGGIEIDVGARISRADSREFYENRTNPEKFLQHINSGSYNLQDPASSPPDVLEEMTVDTNHEWSFDQEEIFALVAWDWLKTEAGDVQWAIGGEFREEALFWTTDSGSSDVAEDRSTSSLYFETMLPLTQGFELSFAGRYDDYSDWGNNFSPKVSMRWRIYDELLIRASWGEGFRAPELSINTIEPFSRGRFRRDDPQSCIAIGRQPGCWFLYQDYYTVSSALTAETSEQYSVGLVWEPADWISTTVDYFDISIDDEIGGFGTGSILRMEQLGLDTPPGLGVVRSTDPNTPGLIVSITRGVGNWGLVETSGIDWNTQINFDLGEGRIRSNLQYAYLFEHASTTEEGGIFDKLGLPGNPRSRATLSTYYDIGKYTFSWNISYIEEQFDSYIDDATNERVETSVPSWVTHDLQANYRFSWDGRLSVGVQNAFERTPSDATSGADYNYNLYDYYGRVYYLNYTQTFD